MAFSNVSAVTKHFSDANEGFVTTLASTITAGAATVPLSSVADLTDNTVVVWVIEPGTAKEQTLTGTVDTANSRIIDTKWTRGTNVSHSAGVTIVDFVTGTDHNMMAKGIQVSHEQDGTLNGDALDQITAALLPIIYPVGSIYTNATDATNPATLLGFGTWTAFGAGRVPVGYDAGQTEFNASEKTGGSKTHTLTESEMPSHEHGPLWQTFMPQGTGSLLLNDRGGDGFLVSDNCSNGVNGEWKGNDIMYNAGGGAAHNNLQPYITVYLWKRTV